LGTCGSNIHQHVHCTVKLINCSEGYLIPSQMLCRASSMVTKDGDESRRTWGPENDRDHSELTVRECKWRTGTLT